METLVEDVIEQIQSMLGDIKAEKWVTVKNNGVEITGIILRNEDTGDRVAPIIYIDDLIENGLSTDEIANYIVKSYRQSSGPDPDLCAEIINDFDTARKGLSMILVNKKMNQKEIDNYIYWDFLDLAFILVYQFDDCLEEGCIGRMKISKKIANNWGISEKQLYDVARKNMMLERSKCINLADVLKESEVDLDFSPEMNMLVITNKSGTFGAARILDKEVLRRATDIFNSDLVLVPSSVHEWIAMPYYNFDSAYLSYMINDVNATQLKKTDILSDHAYLYVRSEDRVISY